MFVFGGSAGLQSIFPEEIVLNPSSSEAKFVVISEGNLRFASGRTEPIDIPENPENPHPFTGAFNPISAITICRSFHASPFWRGSRSRNAG